jgi:hypothetical protein
MKRAPACGLEPSLRRSGNPQQSTRCSEMGFSIYENDTAHRAIESPAAGIETEATVAGRNRRCSLEANQNGNERM